jgi:glucose/arabinose dehydrogenase
MTLRTKIALLASACVLGLATAFSLPGDTSESSTIGYGRNPELPFPRQTLITTVNVATARPWSVGEMPTATAGFEVSAFARGLDHPRWIYVLPNGDVLVAESNSPGIEPAVGIRGWIMERVMGRAGAAVPSPNRIILLRDADGDGMAETRTTFLQGLYSPFGMALVGNDFYVANADAIVRFPYTMGETSITAQATKVVELPGAPLNHHWTKNIIASQDGTKLYATVGSNSNIAENGLEVEEGRAAIWEIDRATGRHRIFASGLRNPNGLAWEPETGALWTAVNERDELGDNLVPDYITSVRDGGFYGWPYSYFGQHVDERVKPPRPDLVAQAIAPDYAVGAHTASLGLAFYEGDALPARYRGGAFIGQHGSWNRTRPAGYKVIFVPFENGRPTGALPEDVLTGFLEDGEARGRPVGVAVDSKGALLVADDVGNAIWRVTGSVPPTAGLR